ncbi:Dual specificity tyrosine-phosphorylation-regulated kinase 2, partial [Paramuricea clavata]
DIFHPNERHVAIKILHASYCNLGPQEASCLLHLRKADTLKVANIAHILNTFTVGEHFCIVFEFLLPLPLYKYFQMFSFPSKAEKINLIRRIGFQVTQSLAVLSSLNIIHCDVKPENILFTDGDKKDVKLIDFGNAIYCIHDEMSLYFESFELQTVFYRAPEVMFGLLFGPQIDMWSLGCVLAEFYLGEPLFLAMSKDEILEKMQALLGPFPMSPFQTGKYFSTFKKFVGRVSPVPGFSKNVVNIMKKLGSTDYVFADFLAKLLTFDPNLRLSPNEALRHPFLAPECTVGFMLPPGYMTQESTYSPILLTPATYPHRPKIDEDIKKLRYSELDLLRVGTQASTMSKADNVMKVLPFNYQEESSNENKEEKCIVKNESNAEGRESRNTAGKNTAERFGNNETAGIFGVSIENKSHDGCPVDRRDNPYNESCSVLHTTKDTRAISVKEDQTYNDYGDSCSVVNLVKDTKLLQGSAIRGHKDKTFGVNTTNETCSSALFSKHDERDKPFDPNESCSISNAIKDPSSFTTPMKGGQRDDAFDETCMVLNTAKDKCLSTLFAKQHERDNPLNESCSVLNTIKNSLSLIVHKGRGENEKHGRKFVLRRSSKNRRRRDSERESRSTVSREDNKDFRKPYNAQSMSPAKLSDAQDKSPVKFINDHEVLLVNLSEPRDITRTANSSPVRRTSGGMPKGSADKKLNESSSIIPHHKGSSRKHSDKESNSAAIPPTRRTSRHDERTPENMRRTAANRVVEDSVTATRKAAYRRSSSETSYKEIKSATPPTRRTNKFKFNEEISEDMPKTAANRVVEDDVTATRKTAYKRSSSETSYKETDFATPPTRTTSKCDDRILEDIQKGAANRVIEDNVTATRKTAYKRSSSETSYKETDSATPSTRRTSKLDEEILENMPKSATDRKVDGINIIVSPKATHKSTSSETSDEETSPARWSIGRQNKRAKSSAIEMKSLGNCAEESGGKSRNETCVSKTKDRPNPSAVGRRKCKKSQQVLSSGVKDDAQTKPTLPTISHQTRDDVSTTCNNYQDLFSVTSSSKQVNADSYRNAKKPVSTKLSVLESFFDTLSDDETNLVSSSTNSGELRIKTKGISKRSVPTNSKVLTKNENSSSSEKLTPISSSIKQDKLSQKSCSNGNRHELEKLSNFQAFSEDTSSTSSEEVMLITSSNTQDELPPNSGNNWKRSKSPKSSIWKSLSEDKNSSSGLEVTLVTSSSKEGRLHAANSSNNGNRTNSAKSSNLQVFSEDKNSSFDEELTFVISTNTQDKLQTKSITNEKGAKSQKSKNVQAFSRDKNSSFGEEVMLVTFSNTQDRRLARRRNDDNRNMSANSWNFQSFSEGWTSSSGSESKIVTSSINQGNKSIGNVSSLEHKEKPRTPNFQKKESVFDTPMPCSLVRSTGELLPGGLSEVKKTICRAEMEQDNSLYEIHDILQARLVGDADMLNEEKQNTEKSGETYTRYNYTSPKQKTERVFLERNSQLVKGGQVLKNESQDSKRVSKEKGNRNLPEEMDTSYPRDILTQEAVKQPRKRKLEYSTVNSPGKSHTMFCLESLKDRQSPKIQKLPDDSDDDYDVLLL